MKGLKATLAVSALLALAPTAAQATTILVTTDSGLTTDGTIDWGTLGGPFTPVANGTTVATGIGGITAGVSEVSTTMQRLDQDNGWSGNFGAGEELLWTGTGGGGPITLNFSSPVAGAGAQIQYNFIGAFMADIQAFDSLNNLLGSFTLNGNSTSDGDDSAIFIGILSSSTDISRLVFGVPNPTFPFPQDFAINNVIVQGTADPVAVPEPATLVLLGLGGLGVVRRLRRTSQKNA